MDEPRKGSRATRIALWVLCGLLAVLFLMAGGSKLAGAQPQVEHFSKWGYPGWFRLLIGAVEAAAAVALMIPRVAALAAGVLAAVMAGAIYTHVRHDEAMQALVPGVLLALLACVGYLRRHGSRKMDSGEADA